MMNTSQKDSLLNQILAFSTNNLDDLEQLHILLSDRALLNDAVSVSECLNQLHPYKHSLAYLYLLLKKLELKQKEKYSDQHLFNEISNFLHTCNPEQLRPHPQLLKNIIILPKNGLFKLTKYISDFTLHILNNNKNTITSSDSSSSNAAVVVVPYPLLLRTIFTLRRVLEIFGDIISLNQLTPIHTIYLYLCIKCKHYSMGADIAGIEINDIDHSLTGVQPLDNLLYHYYAGLIFTGLKQYKNALKFYICVLSSPCRQLSQIQVFAYQKHVLLSLMLYGKVSPLPSFTSSIVERWIASSCPIYSILISAYLAGNLSYSIFLNENRVTLIEDGNLGLAKQVLKSLYCKSIQQLTRTYLTLSLSDIAIKIELSSEKVEEYIREMIEEKQIFGRIDKRNGMVVFEEDHEQFDDEETARDFITLIDKVNKLSVKIMKEQQELSISDDYLKSALSREPCHTPGFEDLDPRNDYDGLTDDYYDEY